MPKRKPVVHLVCNAHIDPIWMWQWEEGAREAISTFRTAADFLDEYPEFIFNHNESVLYEWVERHDPALFSRIKQFVKQGRWNISGGWYLQPDCNMPAGETFVRMIAAGRRYFSDRFGVKPKVAYNFDSFGHNGSLPQLLRQAGYEMYIHCRPGGNLCPLPAPQYRWQGLDGSEVLALRPGWGWYGTPEGHAIDSIRRAAEAARETGEDVLVLWGLGDHGGGPTRKDLDIIRGATAEMKDVEIRHSTPEAYLAALKPPAEYPLHKGDLQHSFAGCYTSMSPIKRAMRRGEALLASAERWSTVAWQTLGRPYPQAQLETAWKGVLFNTFHDIMAGSSAEASCLNDVAEIFGRSADICRRLRLDAQLALLPNVAPKPGTIPLYVFNPHACAMTAPVDLDFLMSYMPPPQREPFALYDDRGRKVASQDAGGAYERTAGTWFRNVSFAAEAPALSVRRYEIRRGERPAKPRSPLTVKETKAAIVVENRWVRARFTRSTGGLASLVDKRTGRDLLRGSIRAVAMKDTLDAWGGEENVNFSEAVGEFAPLSAQEVARWAGEERTEEAALQVLFKGPVSVTVQSLVGWRRSRVCQQFTIYADLPYVEARLRVQWQERRQCLKWVLPLRLKGCRAVCEVPFAAIERPVDGIESVGGRWVRMEERKGDRLAVGVANDGQYAFHAREDGELGLSLVRGAIHSRFGDAPARADEYHTYMDQGQHDFRFRLLWGKAPAVAKALVPAAMELNLPLEAFFMYHQPTPTPGAPATVAPWLEVTPDTVVLSALKKAGQGDDVVLRFSETLGRRTRAELRIAGMAKPAGLDFGPFEVKTLRVTRGDDGVTVTACGILE